MKRKLLAALLTASMAAALLAGCGAAEEEGSKDPGPAEETGEGDDAGKENNNVGDGEEAPTDIDGEEDLADITVSFWSLSGKAPDEADVGMVEDAINEITEESINTTVHLNIMDLGTYIPNGAMANGVANGEDFDLVLTAAAQSGSYHVMVSNGMLNPISDLLAKYAPELLSALPEGYLDATTREGQIYAVPSYCNKVKNMYWLEAAGIDIESVKTIDDVDKALRVIKEKTDLIPMGGAANTVNLTFPGYAFGAGYVTAAYDPLGENTAVAAAVYHDDDTHTAVSRYETEEFKTDMAYLKKWYDDGLLDKDVASDNATGNAFLEKDNVASIFYTSQFDNVASLAAQGDGSYVKLANGVVGTGDIQQFTWAIPVSCDEPEASAKFLNLMYTNADIVNLLNYGLEGVHYEKKADGTIGFPEGVTEESSGYYLGNMTSLIGNGFLAYPWEGADPNSAQIARQEMENAQYSPLMGFTLDTAALGDVYTAICPIARNE